CDLKCSTCNNKERCLTCNTTNYKTNDGDCLPQSSIIGCQVKVTQLGCSKCQEGYYQINTNECETCDKNCKTCFSTSTKCTSCDSSHVLLSSGSCVGLSQISKCTEITNSRCSKCSFWNTPSEDGTSCETKAVWWAIIIVVIVSVIIITLSITVIILTTKKILDIVHGNISDKNKTIFLMEKSNIVFSNIQGGICISSNEINFNEDFDEIPVDAVTRQMISVGNTNKNIVKIQFTYSSKIEKFELEVDPVVVTLKKGYACEFSIYLKPLCTCKFHSTIQMISKNIKSGEEKYNEIMIKGLTCRSTRIDYEELIEEKKLGEGSFGIVYRGTFRGNDVAIKVMKSSADEMGGMEEFENEVQMMDKFRSEYVVHFYGACFVPNKICMVTEYAEFGSLSDLIKKKHTSDEIGMKMRVKIMLDSSKGIFYLHENGILHRDIKPDNILVFSLDLDQKINGKLTDFGSSRNINLLMTNMTFTKGIGTPVYMAPEVLKQERYKRCADIFSFGVTMFESFGWCNAYPKKDFTYPWKIAEFVIEGKRQNKMSCMSEKQYDLISECWEHKAENRPHSEDVVHSLQSIYDSL
ncbi:tyrosine protein kinase, putative, partial [Entamoeba invadens IP1]